MGDTVPGWLRSHLQRIDAEVEELQRERKVILDLIADWKSRQESERAVESAFAGMDVVRPTDEIREEIRDKVRGLTAAAALDVAVREAPGRFTKKELANLLEEVVESDASSPRTVIFNAIRRKAQTGSLYVDAANRVHIAESSQNGGLPEGRA